MLYCVVETDRFEVKRHMEFLSHSVTETEALGQRLGQALHPGDVVAYFGDLGAGKTRRRNFSSGSLESPVSQGSSRGFAQKVTRGTW